jgi:GR25 family glycosyltransferase involved in LPS biosynthesis
MDDPLRSSIGPGTFRVLSEKNKDSDLARIIDNRDESLLYRNKISMPTVIIVLNLDERKDRWNEFQRINSEKLLNFNVIRFSASKGTDPKLAIFNSYVACLEEAFREYESIIIMEDDAYVLDGWEEKLASAFKSLPEEWDALIGNHYFFGSMEILNDHIARPTGIASTMNFGVYNKTILDKIKNNLHLRTDDRLDIDHFITSRETPIINFSIWPMIAREYISHSDHMNRTKDMTIRVREHANLFQFIDNDSYYPSLESW